MMIDEKENIGDLPAIADNTLIQLAEQAEKRIDAMHKIKRVALKLTNRHDWTDQNGKPYMQVSGAEKVARLFGISWQIDEPVCENEEGGHYSFTYKGYFSLAGATIEAIGTRSSKDGFFTRYEYGEKDEHGKSKRTALPPSAIDRGDVKKAAYTNLLGNGITRILGLRNLTYDDLQEFAGITKDQITKVEYKSKPKEPEMPGQTPSGEVISEAQRKRLYAIYKGAGKTDDDVKLHLKEKYNVESSKDILKKDYEAICKWAETKERQPGEE
jgi:hypothetical protein